MTRKFIFSMFQFIDRFHWLWLILAAPYLVFPTPKRSLVLLVVPALWILHGILYRGSKYQSQEFKPSSVPRPQLFRATKIIHFLPVTPLDISLLVLAIMVLVSLWATYSIEQSLEKISGLVLGFGVFFAVVRESKNPWGWPLSLIAFLGGGLGWATLGFLGMNYPVRFSFLAPLISRIPVIIKGLPGAESGLQHNAVGGTFLWVLPLLLVLSWFVSTVKVSTLKNLVSIPTDPVTKQVASPLILFQRLSGWLGRVAGHRVMIWIVRLTLWTVTLFIGLVLLLTQSRGSYLAIGVTMLGILFLVLPKRGRWILIGLIGLTVIGLGLLLVQTGGWQGFIDQLGLSAEEGLSTRTLDPRLEIWSRAISLVQDFPIKGMGMNTFREVVHVLYPFFTISPDLDIAHAHNEFLQAALDLGIPGLIAFISIYVISFWMLVKVWQAPSGVGTSPKTSKGQTDFNISQDPVLRKILVLGLGGGLFGHLVFGMTDAITLGAKPGIFYWLLLGLIVGLYNRIEDIKLAN